MSKIFNGSRTAIWSTTEKIIFRIAAIFFLLLAVPLDPKYWRQLFSTHWSHFQDLFQLANYLPHFIATPKWGIASFGNIALALGVAIVGAVVWSFLDRTRTNYADLYDWLRILLRYKLAIAIIGYGIIKLFPLQFPQITLSDLNTEYGDFLPWKIYYLTNSAASAGYERALGLFEIAGGVLLLWRRFATVGAGIVAAALVNIVVVNFAYQLGDHVYASILFLIAFALLANDIPRVFDLLVWRRFARADRYDPAFVESRLRTPRLVLRLALVVFFLVYTVETHASYRYRSWPFPETSGVANAAGLYNVKTFTVNGNTLPYSTSDPVRWQNVVFEKWNTFSVRINRPVSIHVANPTIAFDSPGSARDFELAGNGGRHFYSYATGPDGSLNAVGKNDQSESFSFHLIRPNENGLQLNGTDQAGNHLQIELEKVNKTYLLNEGRRKPLTLY